MSFNSIQWMISWFLAFVLSGGILEGFVRLWIPQKIQPNFYAANFGIQHVLRPDYTLKLVRQRNYPDYTIVTSRNHLRESRALEYKKPKHVYRILCIGDSVLFGPGVNNEELFSLRLENFLNENNSRRRFEVINAAVPGWGLLQYATYLEQEGYKYDPDVVLISSFVDDLRQNFSEILDFKSIQRKKGKIHLDKAQVRLMENAGLNLIMNLIQKFPLYEWLNRESQLFFFVRTRLNSMKSLTGGRATQGIFLHDFLKTIDYRGYDKETWVFDGEEKKLPHIARNPVQFYADLKGEDPVKGQANTVLYFYSFEILRRLTAQLGAKMVVLGLPTYIEVLRLDRTAYRLSDFHSRKNLYWLDLLPAMKEFQKISPTTMFFPKDNHWTPGGHWFAARMVFDYFVKEKIFSEVNFINSSGRTAISVKVKEVSSANLRLQEYLGNSGFEQFVEGIRLKNVGRFKEAKSVLEKYVVAHPDDSEASFQLGRMLLVSRDYARAEVLFEEALKNSKSKIEAYKLYLAYARVFGRIWRSIDKGEYREARSELSKIEKMDFSLEPRIYNILALAYFRMGDLEKANRLGSKYASLNPRFLSRLKTLGAFVDTDSGLVSSKPSQQAEAYPVEKR